MECLPVLAYHHMAIAFILPLIPAIKSISVKTSSHQATLLQFVLQTPLVFALGEPVSTQEQPTQLQPAILGWLDVNGMAIHPA